jgi:hypothetical protein
MTGLLETETWLLIVVAAITLTAVVAIRFGWRRGKHIGD